MKPRIRIDAGKLKAAFQSFSATQKQAILEKTVRTDAMGFVRDIVAITPPGSKGAPLLSGAKGELAVAKAMKKINGDLRHIIHPVADYIIQRAQREDRGVSDGVRLWMTKDGRAYGVERDFWRPDASVEALYDHHRKYFKNGRMTQAGRLTRDIGRWRFVDRLVVRQSVFNEYLQYVQEKVGILAGAWAEAAAKLKVRLPAIAKRHASGACQILIGADSYRVRMTNTVSYASDADLKRRAEFVLDSNKRRKRLAARIKAEITAVLKRKLK